VQPGARQAVSERKFKLKLAERIEATTVSMQGAEATIQTVRTRACSKTRRRPLALAEPGRAHMSLHSALLSQKHYVHAILMIYQIGSSIDKPLRVPQ
jgi:hypothetical protein